MQLRLKYRFEFFVQRKTHHSSNDAHTHIHASIRLSVCWFFFAVAFSAGVLRVCSGCRHILAGLSAHSFRTSSSGYYFLYVFLFYLRCCLSRYFRHSYDQKQAIR